MRSIRCVIAIAAALAAFQAGTAMAATPASGIVDVPVAFSVQNTDTPRSPCLTDGREYVVRGHLTGPRAAIEGPAPRAVTLYYSGYDSGEWNWRFRLVPGYDYATELAKLGHVSLTVDQLGYGASDHPDGSFTCIGAEANIAHQIIGRLRSGSYAAQGTDPVAFSKVVFGAHDIGGAEAEVEAYTYKDVDGLMVFTYQDQGFTPYILGVAANASARCTAGGEPAYPGGPGHYIYYPPVSDWPKLMPNSDPDVITGAIASRQRNPCGLLPSNGETVALHTAGASTGSGGLGEIRVPVMLALGARDPVFTHDGFFKQAAWFSG